MEPNKISDLIGDYSHRAVWTAEAKAEALQAWTAERNECSKRMDRIALAGSPFAGLRTDVIRGAISEPALLEWAETWDGRSGALLTGPTGVGKTAAASLALRLRLERRLNKWVEANPPTLEDRYRWEPPPLEGMRWLSAVALGNAKREARLGQRPEVIVRAEEVELLVIDDLGWEHEQRAVVEVLATRYDAGRLTIATSGLSEAALCKRYSDAVVRRILESRGAKGRIVESAGATSARGAGGGR